MSLELQIKTADGLTLKGRIWAPDQPAAVVYLVHGLGEHSSRYDHVAEAFNTAGYAFVAFDLRGHGRSEGKRGDIPGYDALMDEIFQGLEAAAQRYPGLPLFLYGHSLGGNLVLHYALRRKPELAGVIATAPLLRLAYDPPAWQTSALRLMHALKVNCSMTTGLDDTALSRDLNVVRVYRNDPLTHSRVTPRLAIAMQEAGEWNLAHADEFPCPLLLMHGGDDRITSAPASEEFSAKAGDLCSLKIWAGFFHEIHNEPGKKEVLAEMFQWLEGHR